MVNILNQVFPLAPESMKELLQSQATNLVKDPKGRRWSTQVISICLRLWSTSPKAYKDLRDLCVLVLPSTQLLSLYKNVLQQKPGIIPANLEWMRGEAVRQNVPAAGWRGGLTLDEMQVQDDIQIVQKGQSWKLIGFVDVGTTANRLEELVSG